MSVAGRGCRIRNLLSDIEIQYDSRGTQDVDRPGVGLG